MSFSSNLCIFSLLVTLLTVNWSRLGRFNGSHPIHLSPYRAVGCCDIRLSTLGTRCVRQVGSVVTRRFVEWRPIAHWDGTSWGSQVIPVFYWWLYFRDWFLASDAFKLSITRTCLFNVFLLFSMPPPWTMLRHETNWCASLTEPVFLSWVLHNLYVACCSGKWLNDPPFLSAAPLRSVPLTISPLLVVFPSLCSELESQFFWHSLRLPQDLTAIGFPDKFSFEPTW